MIPTQRAEIARALADLFVLKGKMPLGIDEVVVPVAMVADLTETPYLRYAAPVGRATTQAATAANFAYVMVRPGAARVLQIHAVLIRNPDVAAQTFSIKIGTAAFVAQLDTVASAGRLIDLANPIANTLVSSLLQTALDVAGTDTGSNSIISVDIPAGSSLYVPLPDPGISLYGNDEGGTPALAVKCSTIALGVGASFYGREWPLPGA